MKFTTILQISNINEIKVFNRVFGVKQYDIMDLIDWNEVYKLYDGIEINPKLDYDSWWYDGWDVASGCVWNISKVRVKEIGKNLKLYD